MSVFVETNRYRTGKYNCEKSHFAKVQTKNSCGFNETTGTNNHYKKHIVQGKIYNNMVKRLRLKEYTSLSRVERVGGDTKNGNLSRGMKV